MTTVSLAPSRRPARWERLLPRWLASPGALLLVAFLYYTFVGTHPLAETGAAERADGSPIDRLYVFAQFGLSLVVLWLHRRPALALARGTWVILAIIGFCFVSIVWSDYPDLTLRRGLLLTFLSLAAMGAAAGISDLRRFHTALFAALTAIIIFNILMIGAAPGTAISDIGVKGIYPQKNVAGSVAMIAAIVAATWTLGAPTRQAAFRGLAALAVIVVFLVLTRSKTSIGLAAMALCVIGVFAGVERFGARAALLALSGLIALGAVALALFAAIDFDFNRAFEILLGDASFTGRDEVWAFARRNIAERPWLGHGYGAFWDVGLVNDPIAKLEHGTWLGDVEIGTINQAHNGYLELCLHIGVPATVVAAVAVLFVTAFGAARAVGADAPRSERAAVAAMAAILFVYLVHNYTEATFFMRGSQLSGVATLALFVIARADALFRSRRQSARPTDPTQAPYA